ncbi:MAG: hypothetical protein AAGI38_17710 [Bacteroidota bacterium]
MNRLASQVILPFVVLMIGCLGGLYLVFGPVLLQPNDYLLGAGGDGLKTYYSSIFFVKYVEGFTHHGLGYPFGNHSLYADLNPLLSIIFRWLDGIVGVSPYIVGLTNLTIIVSFFPAVWLMFLILRRTKLPVWWSVVFSLIIIFLTPHTHRFTGYYALSYVFFIPLMWYVLLRMEEGRYYRWLGAYIGSVVILSFAHPYYFLIGIGFLLSWLLIKAIQSPAYFAKHKKQLLITVLLSFLPAIFLKSWEWTTTETPTDFIKTPYGFFEYLTGLEGIFLPSGGYVFELIQNLKSNFVPAEMEGRHYVGLPGLLFLGFFLLNFVNKIRRKQFRRIRYPIIPNTLRPALFASILLLIPASGVLFKLMPFLADWLGFVRQFRSPGRLGWPFYHTYMVLCVWTLYTLFRSLRIRQRKLMGWGLVTVCIVGWLVAAHGNFTPRRNHFLKNRISNKCPEFRSDYLGILTQNGYGPQDFQALLMLPYFHVGSEKISISNWYGSFHGMSISKNTGLPLLNNYVARAPLTSALQSIQLVADPLIPKVLPEKLPSSNPILLVYEKKKTDFRPMEQLLIKRSKPLFKFKKNQYSILDISAFSDTRQEKINAFRQRKDSLISFPNQVYADNPLSTFLMNGYGDAFFEGDSLGAKATSFPYKGPMHLFEDLIPNGVTGRKYEVSCWVKIDRQSNYLPYLQVRQFKEGKEIDRSEVPMKELSDIYESWLRASVTFELLDTNEKVLIRCGGEHLTFDQLMIKPANAEVYQILPGNRLMYNNYYLGEINPAIP